MGRTLGISDINFFRIVLLILESKLFYVGAYDLQNALHLFDLNESLTANAALPQPHQMFLVIFSPRCGINTTKLNIYHVKYQFLLGMSEHFTQSTAKKINTQAKIGKVLWHH